VIWRMHRHFKRENEDHVLLQKSYNSFRRLASFLVVAVGFMGISLFVAHLITQAAMANSPCDPATEICMSNVSPALGSTDGGGSIGSAQNVDTNGNPYDAPNYNPSKPITIDHDGMDIQTYQEVDYIEFTTPTPTSTATLSEQFINTGINFLMTDTSIKMEMDVEYTRTTGQEQITGLRATGSYIWRFFLSYYQGAHYAGVGGEGTPAGISLAPGSAVRKTLGVEYNRSSLTYRGYLNGNPTSSRPMAAPAQTVGPLYIGAVNDTPGPTYPSNYKLYSFTVEKNGALVADYMPAWSIINQEFGLIDRITGDFFGNSSTGTIAGPNLDVDGNPRETTLSGAPTVNFTVGVNQVGTCDSVTLVSPIQLTCVPSAWDDTHVSTPIDSQAVDINMFTSTRSGILEGGYTYRAPMVLSSISPYYGSTAGGQSVTINGTNLLPADFSDDYELVEYVQFTDVSTNNGNSQSTQFVDSGVSYLAGDTSIKMEIDAAYTRVAGYEQITGLRATGSNVWRLFVSISGTGTTGNTGNLYSNAGDVGTAQGVPLGAPVLNKRETFGVRYDRNTRVIQGFRNGGEISTTKTTPPPSGNVGPLYIGAVKDTSGATYSSNYRVYGFKVEKDDVVVANLLPIKNVDSGECGFWDTITRTAKWNSGFAPLTCGSPVGSFISLMEVTVDGNPCAVTDASETAITCTLPAGTIGAKDVVVSDGSETITKVGGFTYTDIALSISTNDGVDDSGAPVVKFDVSPSSSVDSDYMTVLVSSNNPTGYNLSMVADGSDLICTDYPSNKFTSIAANGSLSDGEWGWNIADGAVPATAPSTWRPLPTSSSSLAEQTIASSLLATNVSGDPYFVWFGAKASWTQKPGCKYRQAVVYTATTNL